MSDFDDNDDFGDFDENFVDFFNRKIKLTAGRAKKVSDQALPMSTEVATQAALTTIMNNINTAALAGSYSINVDTTTLTGVDIAVVVNTLHAQLGYTVQTIGTNMNIDWSYAPHA